MRRDNHCTTFYYYLIYLHLYYFFSSENSIIISKKYDIAVYEAMYFFYFNTANIGCHIRYKRLDVF